MVLKKANYAKSTLLALTVTLIFAAPFWYSTFSFSETELTQITVMTRTHSPILTPQVLVILLLCSGIFMLLQKGILRQLPGIVALSLLLSAIGALNQRVVTGVEVQSWHYQIHLIPQVIILTTALVAAACLDTQKEFRWNKSIPITVLIASVGIVLVIAGLFINLAFVTTHISPDGVLSRRSQSILRDVRMLAGITGIILTIGAFIGKRPHNRHRTIRLTSILYALTFIPFAVSVGVVQYQLYHGYLKPHLGYMQALAPALEWLNTHTKKESVVLCSLNYTTPHVVIPIYTHNNLYIAPLAGCYPVPTSEEIRDRMYNVLYVMGVTSRQDFEQYWPHGLLEGSFAEYQKKLTRNLYATLAQYRVDYLFYGPREQASFKFDPGTTYPFLKRVYQDQTVTIYRILKPTRSHKAVYERKSFALRQ
jgi:hypothetical protein